MKKNHSSPKHKRQGKDKHFKAQKLTVFQYLQSHVATASMIEEATGVKQKCITRYKRDLEKAGQLWQVFYKRCKKTGCKAWYLTTDPTKAPQQHSKQLKLF